MFKLVMVNNSADNNKVYNYPHLKSVNTKKDWTYVDGNSGLVQVQAQKGGWVKPVDQQHRYLHNINLQI